MATAYEAALAESDLERDPILPPGEDPDEPEPGEPEPDPNEPEPEPQSN
jgi:hypothetical protein